MHYDNKPRRRTAQMYDFLDAARRAGKPLSLPVLLPLERKFHGPAPLWTKREMEAGKYALPGGWNSVSWPSSDALLGEHIGRFLLHVRREWTIHVWRMRHKAFSFEEFLAQYVGGRLNIDERLDDPSAQTLRLATGQPQHLPIKRGARR
jgi:hypothetical protein